MIISNWQNCVIHQYHIMKVDLFVKYFKIITAFQTNNFYVMLAFCKHMNL